MYGVCYRQEIPTVFRQKTEKEATRAHEFVFDCITGPIITTGMSHLKDDSIDDTESGISLSDDVGLIHL